MANTKYKEAIKRNYDTRVVVLDLIYTDELNDLLFDITKKMGKFIWVESYDGYLDDGEEDRVEIVISDTNSRFFKKPVEYLLNYLSKKNWGQKLSYISQRRTGWIITMCFMTIITISMI